MRGNAVGSTEDKEIRIENLRLIKPLWPFIRPYFWMLSLTTLLVFVVTCLELVIPYLTGKAFDGFIVPAASYRGLMIFGFHIDSFTSFGIIFASFVFIMFIIDFVQSIFMEYTGQKIILNLRCSLFFHMSFLPVAFYDKNSSGRLVSRVAGDVENMNEMFTSVLIFIFKDLLLMAGILIILFTMNIKLAFYLSLLVPVIVVSIGIFSKIMRKIFRTIRQKIAEINHSFSEAITGIKIIQTSSSNTKFMQRFENLNFEYFTASLFQIKVFSTFMPFIGFLGVLSVAIIIWAGSFDIVDKSMTIGELVAFLTYMKLFFRPLRELSEKFNLLQNALASAERIVNVLNNEKAEQRTTKTRNYIKQIFRIALDNVNFSYDKDKQVLKDISFTLNKGESIGIVGRTGSGKSSIINLITGFYPLDSGAISFNDINQASVNIEDIRKKTALVMQDPLLFSGTIRENIRPSEIQTKNKAEMQVKIKAQSQTKALTETEIETEIEIKSQTEIDDKILEKALKDANCQFLFEQFSGLDTEIGEGGRPLSSGEKQLVCIARAFAFNPDLIIFDEATSYMDSQSENKIHDAMGKLMQGRLAIIIAHRLSTVRNCNNIMVLRDGAIIEHGSHPELVKLKGEYYHLLKKEKI